MSLQQYFEKRNFKATPEPRPHRFVVQKHAARRLHYDFRLEVHGVLKSWAVPKGPSLNPDDKRLAMMTEDHPLEYRTFEGTIPKGQYGAGDVIVWDEGTYELRAKTDIEIDEEIEKKLKKGHLSIVVYGKKLRGEFSLVKNEKADDNSWFLIKKNDEYVSKEDVTELQSSVRSKKAEFTIETIKHVRKSEIHDAKSGPITPMLASSVDEPFDDKNWVFEIKWDGYRGIAEIGKGGVKLYSRNGKDFSIKFSPIIDALKSLDHTCVLDGEIAVLDEKGISSFQYIQNYLNKKSGHVVYIIFDLLYLDGYDMRDVPLIKRKEILKTIIPHSEHLQFSDHIENKGKEFFALAKQQKIEGVIAKEKYSLYRDGVRSKQWLKIKTKYQEEAIICGYTEPRGGRKYFGALILGQYNDGKLTYIGHTGTGFDDPMLKKVKELLDHDKTDRSPFAVSPIPNAPVQWVTPKLVSEVAFTEWTKDGVMRHPVFLGIREDKSGYQIPNEEEKLTVTNLDKLYFPKDMITKGDILAYYRQVANVMLPYVVDRPQTLNRFPDGIERKSFYQKDLVEHPEWVTTVPVYSEAENKKIHYFVCKDKESLLYVANLGCIEINVWNSRVNNLENPDYLVIDLDPEDIGFDKVINTALVVREVLEKAGISSFPKTSGATGLHIYLPLAGKYPHEIVRKFAEIIAHIVHGRAREYTSIIRLPRKRQKKVYIDFLQNRYGQTMAAPYSIRPRKGATVSAPLHWDEVNHDLRPDMFTIKTMSHRIEKIGDVWEGLLEKEIDIENALMKLRTET